MGRRFPARFWVSLTWAILGAFQFGYHLGVPNIPMVDLSEQFDFSLSGGASILVGSMLVGAFLSALTAGSAVERYGIRGALALFNLPVFASTLVSGLIPRSAGFWALCALRFGVGLGVGPFVGISPQYLAEVSPAQLRGRIGVLNAVGVASGILTSYVLGVPYGVGASRVGGVAWWRVMFSGAAAFSAVMWGLTLVAPESPTWLRDHGRAEEADAAISKLYGLPPPKPGARYSDVESALGSVAEDEDGDGEDVRGAAEKGGRKGGSGDAGSGETADVGGVRFGSETVAPAAVEATVEAAGGKKGAEREDEEEAAVSPWEAMMRPGYRKATLLAMGAPSLLQLSGVNTVIIFSSAVFADAGLDNAVVGAVIVGAANLIGAAPAFFLIERSGRRSLIFAGHLVMGTCLALVSVFYFSGMDATVRGWLTVACFVVYMVFFNIGPGSTAFVYAPEILPDEIRSQGMTLANAAHWLLNIAVGTSWPFLSDWIGVGAAFLIYVALNACGVCYAQFLMVETIKRTFRQISARVGIKQSLTIRRNVSSAVRARR
ncbi:unnamed protein product [Pedinophyceae sp. YPF-701]|nr:unnamed protein product [Pedinophyceae sp. YPF-701]